MALADSIERFAKTPTHVKALALVAITVVIGAIFYFVFYSDLLDQSARIDGQMRNLQTEKTTYETRKQQYMAFRAEVHKLLEEQKELVKVLPTDANISTFLESIHAQAELAGLNILYYDQQNEIPTEFYAQIPVRMAVQGTYHQIMKFFHAVEKNLKRIVRVQDLLLGEPRGNEQGLMLTASFVASTYRFTAPPPPPPPPAPAPAPPAKKG